MSIDRDPPFYFDVACDSCSIGEARVEAEYFHEAVAHIKALGWKIIKTGGSWEHQCPDCARPGWEFD